MAYFIGELVRGSGYKKILLIPDNKKKSSIFYRTILASFKWEGVEVCEFSDWFSISKLSKMEAIVTVGDRTILDVASKVNNTIDTNHKHLAVENRSESIGELPIFAVRTDLVDCEH